LYGALARLSAGKNPNLEGPPLVGTL